MGLFDKWKKKEEPKEEKKDPYASVNNPQKVNTANPYAKKEETPVKKDPYANIGKSSNDPYANIGKTKDPYANIGKTNDPYSNIGKANSSSSNGITPQKAAPRPSEVGNNKSVTFTFSRVPSSLQEFKTLPEASLDTPFKSVALMMLACLIFENNQDLFFEILDFLNGPDSVTGFSKQFYSERLKGKTYIVKSFFKGSNPGNNYTPTLPLTIDVFENPYSYPEDNWAMMLVESSGADSLRQVKLRKKPSTGQWFIVEALCLGDIRMPTSEDPWA